MCSSGIFPLFKSKVTGVVISFSEFIQSFPKHVNDFLLNPFIIFVLFSMNLTSYGLLVRLDVNPYVMYIHNFTDPAGSVFYYLYYFCFLFSNARKTYIVSVIYLVLLSIMACL